MKFQDETTRPLSLDHFLSYQEVQWSIFEGNLTHLQGTMTLF